MIPGPGGALEARYHFVPSGAGVPIVLVIPPYPDQGVDMDHPVVRTFFRAFASLRFNVLRFNFRGCGKSQGEFSPGESEISDAAACLSWLQARNPFPPQCWVAGFSFGAYIALQLLMRRPECSGFAVASPPVNLYDFNFLSPCPSPGLILQGAADEVTSKEHVMRFSHQLSLQKRGHPITLEILPKVPHDFSDALEDVESLVRTYVSASLESLTQTSVRAG